MKKILTFILILFCMPAMAQHISISIGVPGAYIQYNSGYYYRYHDYRYRYRYYDRNAPVIIYPEHHNWRYRHYDRGDRYEHEPYIIRNDAPIIYNRYPSGYNYTIGR